MRYSSRYICELAIGVVVAALVIRTWLLMGLVVPVTVAGSSMAPTLEGPHRAFHCPDCQTDFSIGLDQQPSDPRAVCPACGSRRAVAPTNEEVGGDRLFINRAAFAWREPQRSEVVVFRCPQQADQLCIKRVVGLPGEQVTFAHGDLFVDGRLVRKTLTEQQALRQLVYRAAADQEPRSLDQAAWEMNLASLSDAMLTVQVQLADDSRLGMMIESDAGRFDLSYDAAARQIHIHHDDRLLTEATLPESASSPNRFREWIFSLFDRQALVAIDDRVVVIAPYEVREPPRSSAFPAQPHRAKVAIYGLGGTIREPTVWRDAYYAYRYGDRRGATPASALSPVAAATWQLGPHEFFVLGDNAEISDDSRSWLAGPGLDARLLVGKPWGVR
jgi:signal peptidase I